MMTASAAPAWAEKFTVAVVPDTQRYSDVKLPQPRGEETFRQQMQYLVDKRDEKNLVFVSFVGDIVETGGGRWRMGPKGYVRRVDIGELEYLWQSDQTGFRDFDTRAEWDIANRAISVLTRAGIAFGMVPGNHDYDDHPDKWDPNFQGKTRPVPVAVDGRTWDFYFGPKSPHFLDKPWYGGSFDQGMNSYQFFSGGGRRFLHLSLEFNPGPAALTWAQGVIDANPGLPVIMSTHNWLLPAAKSEGGYSPGVADGTNHLFPQEIWDRFVRKNPAIFLILCGHQITGTGIKGVVQGENLRIDRNDAGYPVYQVLQDYQDYTVGPDGQPGSANGGAGWLRFIEFDTDRRKIHFYTYSTLLNRYAGRNGEQTFGVDSAQYSDFELDFPPQLLE